MGSEPWISGIGTTVPTTQFSMGLLYNNIAQA